MADDIFDLPCFGGKLEVLPFSDPRMKVIDASPDMTTIEINKAKIISGVGYIYGTIHPDANWNSGAPELQYNGFATCRFWLCVVDGTVNHDIMVLENFSEPFTAEQKHAAKARLHSTMTHHGVGETNVLEDLGFKIDKNNRTSIFDMVVHEQLTQIADELDQFYFKIRTAKIKSCHGHLNWLGKPVIDIKFKWLNGNIEIDVNASDSGKYLSSDCKRNLDTLKLLFTSNNHMSRAITHYYEQECLKM